MINQEELIQALAQLDEKAFETVVNTVYRRRGDFAVHAEPSPGATAEQFAQWIARRHLSSDPALTQAVYLPTGSPPREIRLLEVNRLLSAGDSDPVEPLDFTPESDQPFRVFVADVTTDQWERIKSDPGSLLPAGWELPGNKIIGRELTCP